MKKSLATKIAKEWNERLSYTTEATKTRAVVCEEKSNSYHVEILPCGGNNGMTFYHLNELFTITSFYRVSAFISTQKLIEDYPYYDIVYALIH